MLNVIFKVSLTEKNLIASKPKKKNSSEKLEKKMHAVLVIIQGAPKIVMIISNMIAHWILAVQIICFIQILLILISQIMYK